jgi:tyrosinase
MANHLTRHNIWTLSNNNTWHPIILAYARAVGVLQDRDSDPDDPTRWEHQTQVHWFDNLPQAQLFLNQCQHGSWYFLPWHRMYLYHFEAIIRSVIADDDSIDAETKATWALPYWDYTKGENSRKLPPAFAEQQLPDGARNPLFDDTRYINNGEALDFRTVDITAALFPSNFVTTNVAPGFGGPKTAWHHTVAVAGPLEGTPHGSVHTSVGDNMAGLDTAPTDPIFWLHHANIDRLWQVWLDAGQNHQNTNDPDWLSGEEFWFYNAARQQVKMTTAEVVDSIGQLNYEYEDTSVAGPLGEEPVEPEPDHPAQLVGATEEPIQLTGETTNVGFAVGAPAGPLDAEAAPSRVYLRLDDLTSADLPRVPYAVYLNIPDDDPSTPDDRYVGTASTFGIEQRANPDNDHPEGMRLLFDITDLYRRLNEAQQWSDRVSVRFVPLYVQPPAGPLDAGERVPGAEQRAGTINVGQVSVQFQ